MAKPTADGTESTYIVAPAAAESALEEKGFSSFACGTNGFDIAAQIEFRDRMCRLTAEQSPGILKQLEKALGEHPSALCGMAEIVLGPWDRAQGGQS